MITRHKLDFWKSDIGLVLIAGWRRQGEDAGGLAKKMGLSRRALAELSRDEGVAEAMKIDKEAADFMVEEAVWKKGVAGDQKAVEFWLKHRKPAKWSDNKKAQEGENADKLDFKSLAELLLEAGGDDV